MTTPETKIYDAALDAKRKVADKIRSMYESCKSDEILLLC